MAKATTQDLQNQRHLAKVQEARQQLQILRAHMAELSDMAPRSLFSDLISGYREHLNWMIKEHPAYLQAAAELYLENAQHTSPLPVDDE